MKKVISLVLVFVLVMSALPNVVFAAGETNLVVSSTTVEPGASGTVTVSVSNNTTGFDQFAFIIKKTEGITINSVDFNNSIVSGLNPMYGETTGIVSGMGSTDVTNDGTICNINFTLDATATQNAQISIEADPDANGVLMNGQNVISVICTEGTITVGSAGSEDPAIPTNVTYTANLDTTSTAVKVGDEVTVNILVGGTTKEFASSELNLTYTGLTYVSGKSNVNGADVTAANGAIKIIDHGESTSWTEGNTVTAYALVFTVDSITGASGTASVTLSNAALSTAANATGSNLTSATVTVGTKTFTVTPADLKVSVPGELTASGSAEEKTVVYGDSFVIEAADKNYNYEISAVVTGTESPVTITPDSTVDGKWTIASVTDDVTITVTKKEAKQFSVTINTMDHIEGTPATGDKAATYMTPYTFTLKANEAVKENGESGWTYSVDKITIGGQDYTATNEGQVYTIAGEAITGDIVITTKKTEVKPYEYTITVNRTDVSTEELVVEPSDKVATNGSITLTLNPVAGYTYTVTYKFGDGEAQNVTWTTGENGVKTATITNLTGNVTINASKEVNAEDIDVTVSEKEYLALNGKTMYLVQVTSKLDSGYVYTYGGSAMYYSNEYNKDNGGAYVYLVINDADDTLTDEEALAQISIAQGNVAATVDYSGDVNMTNRIDANDAQLVWNMYNAKDNQDNTYSDFNTVGMEKFLRADVNKDGKVDVNDASAVVTAVKNRTN